MTVSEPDMERGGSRARIAAVIAALWILIPGKWVLSLMSPAASRR